MQGVSQPSCHTQDHVPGSPAAYIEHTVCCVTLIRDHLPDSLHAAAQHIHWYPPHTDEHAASCRDGTTSMVLFIGDLMKQAERQLGEGVHPRIITEVTVLPALAVQDLH